MRKKATVTRLLPAALSAVALCVGGRAARGGGTITTLATFAGTGGTGNTGYGPYATLVADSAGNLYGTTVEGGSANDGTVFELSGTGHQTATTTLSFPGGNDGANPYAGLTIDAAGNLYGTTEYGGGFGTTGGYGTAFEVSGSGPRTLTTLVPFTDYNGAYPRAGLTLDSAGNLWGVTTAAGFGGTNSGGAIFKLSGANHTSLAGYANFNYSNASTPYTAPYIDAAGNVVGTTALGGTAANYGRGTVYLLNTAGQFGKDVSTLVNFDVTHGDVPSGNLLADAAGNLYGTTEWGGPNGDGTVYELSGTNHQTLTTLATFNGSNGTQPYAGITAIDAAGNLYGTTVGGGAYGYGTVFELSGTGRQTLTTLFSFNKANGANPYGGVTADAAGVLYGTTYAGGAKNDGTAYALTGTPFVLPPVNVNGNYQFNASTGTGGVQVTDVSALFVNDPGATITVAPSSNSSSRQLIVLPNVVEPAGSGSTSTTKIDLANNDLDVAPSPFPGAISSYQYLQAVAAGYHGGGWNATTAVGGLVLDSSTAAADPTRTTALAAIVNNQNGTPVFTAANPFDGVTPGPSDVLVKYTYYGDANLDGRVDGADYGRIDAGYLSGGTLTGWYNGDFNYDGHVDASDYTLIDNAFNAQSASLSTAVLAAAGTDEVAAVPEPAAAILLCSAGLGRPFRRRRPGQR